MKTEPNETTQKLFIRINGIGHAFSRELGCDCLRCRTINFSLQAPPSGLCDFPGWDDPPWRAHTSGSLFFAGPDGKLGRHILIDAGAGVVDSLVCSTLDGLFPVQALLITHWHPDHTFGLNQLCESLRRSAKRRGMKFEKVPVYTTLDTYDRLRNDRGCNYEFKTALRLIEIVPEVAFELPGTPVVKVTPIPVAHGSVEGAVIFVFQVDDKKVVFGWDIDVPDAKLPKDGGRKEPRTNAQVFENHSQLLLEPDVYFVPANTWNATGTGHTSFEAARHYIRAVRAKRGTYLLHMSGHEDGSNNPGFGWTDQDWETHAQLDKEVENVRVAKQGMILSL